MRFSKYRHVVPTRFSKYHQVAQALETPFVSIATSLKRLSVSTAMPLTLLLVLGNSLNQIQRTRRLVSCVLRNDIIPVVMGAHPDDYTAVLPPNSFIHVDHFASPKELATHLRTVAANRTLYNSFFAWRGHGQFINTRFWCRLCAMVHGTRHTRSYYSDLNRWFSGASVCQHAGRSGWATWRKQPRQLAFLPSTYTAHAAAGDDDDDDANNHAASNMTVGSE